MTDARRPALTGSPPPSDFAKLFLGGWRVQLDGGPVGGVIAYSVSGGWVLRYLTGVDGKIVCNSSGPVIDRLRGRVRLVRG